MNGEVIADVAAACCLILGALLSLTAAIGVLRFPDVLSRMHAVAKPQVLGMLLLLIGLALRLRTPIDFGMIALVALFQLLTAPVSAHMIGRAAYRTAQVDEDLLLVDELSDRDNGADEDPAPS